MNDVHFYHVNYTSKRNKIIGDSIVLYRDYDNEEREFEYRGNFKVEDIQEFIKEIRYPPVMSIDEDETMERLFDFN